MTPNTLKNKLTLITAKRRWLKRLIGKHLPRKAFYPLNNELDFYFDPKDMRGPSFHFAYDLETGFRNYEENSKELLLQSLPDEGVFYDIGANIGLFSIYMALKRRDLSIVCFEPEELAFDCLSSSVSSMKRDQFTLFNKAVGKKNEILRIFKSTINDGGHTLIDRGNDADHVLSGEVEVVNIDTLIKEGALKGPHAIKIDVEGFESEVLEGMRETILQYRPALLIECSNENLSKKQSLWEILTSFQTAENTLGFQLPEDLKERDLIDLPRIAEERLKAGFPLDNYFFLFKN